MLNCSANSLSLCVCVCVVVGKEGDNYTIAPVGCIVAFELAIV